MKTELFPYIRFYKTVTSTNTLALGFLHESTCTNNFVICAKEQHNGRGRHTRSWYSPVGGLYCTLGFPQKRFPASITLFTGIVIHKVLHSIFPELQFSIKWPNDIHINNLKVGGILTSSNDSGTVMGIGIDCNMKNIPERLEGIATSLLIESGRKISLKKLLRVFLNTFENNFRIFEEDGFCYYRS
ncbi:MAG: biotin--[acetyl-CoA-carboxylase] ligase, partial [Candidatus Cloacimonetes bacterium]|nr:biotin--[acetyl-CoA-carboxylase] ligase [Candidatus Cloacimonadota bacterium]